jgi:hypothetical protein
MGHGTECHVKVARDRIRETQITDHFRGAFGEHPEVAVRIDGDHAHALRKRDRKLRRDREAEIGEGADSHRIGIAPALAS